MSRAAANFEALVGELDYPMFVVTVASGEERDGCLVGFATQAGIDPPRFVICVSKRNRTYRVAARANALAVHVLPADAGELAELFGGRTGDDVDKFAQVEWEPGPRELPILAACPNWFAGAVLDRMDCGDHVAFLLEPFAAGHEGGHGELTFRRARSIDPGHPA